jgi:hypothetical protein
MGGHGGFWRSTNSTIAVRICEADSRRHRDSAGRSHSGCDPRREQVFKADAPEHFRTDPIRDAVDNLAAVL